MNGTSIIRPWQPAPMPKVTSRPASAVATEADERLMMARLFSKAPAPAAANEAARPAPRADDDFAPNLGRHVDVVA